MAPSTKSLSTPASLSSRHLLYSIHSPSHSLQSPPSTDSPSPASSSPTFFRHLHHPHLAPKPPLPIVSLAISPLSTNSKKAIRTLALAARSELKIIELHHHHILQDRQTLKLNSFGVSDLEWGYAASRDTLLGGSANGSILGWDLSGGLVNRLDHAHGRAINRVTVAGPSGQWVVSGAQDGFIKVWDLRKRFEKRAEVVLTTHSDPVRQLRFNPHRTSQPFSLLSLTDSGTLTHYDLRNASPKSSLSRRVAHTSPGSGLDWSLHGLIATAGSDEGIVKIWSMQDGGTLSSSALKTIVVGRPIRLVVWRPGVPNQVAITPSSSMADPTMVLGHEGSHSSFGSNEELTGAATAAGGGGGGRHSEILVWDIRRERVPELVINGRDGPASGMAWLSEKTLLTTHKRAGAVVIHDLSQIKEEKFADMLPNQALAICPRDGSICFSSGPDDLSSVVVTGLKDIGTPETFEYLAKNYIYQGNSFGQICLHNFQVSARAQLPKQAELWKSFSLYFPPVPPPPSSPNQTPQPFPSSSPSLEDTMRKSLWKIVKDSANVQLAFTIAASFLICFGDEKDLFRHWTLAYLGLLKRYKSLVVVSCEIKKLFPTRESEEVSLRILKQNLGCGACGKFLKSVGRHLGQRCASCYKNYLICSFCHLVVKSEPFRFCGLCGHGVHVGCIPKLGLCGGQGECVTGCGHLDCLMWTNER